MSMAEIEGILSRMHKLFSDVRYMWGSREDMLQAWKIAAPYKARPDTPNCTPCHFRTKKILEALVSGREAELIASRDKDRVDFEEDLRKAGRGEFGPMGLKSTLDPDARTF